MMNTAKGYGRNSARVGASAHSSAQQATIKIIRERRGLFSTLAIVAISALMGGAYLAVDVGIYLGVLGVSMIIIAAAVSLRLRPVSLVRPLLGVLLCAAPIMISVLINDGSWADLLPITVFAGFSFIAYTFGTVVDDRDFGHIIARAATLSVVLFAAACVVYGWDLAGAIRRGQRLVADGMHPNLFGLIAMTIFVAAAVGRDSKNFVFCLIAMLAACLAASSRSALLTLLVIAVVSRLILVRSAWKAVAIVAAMAFLLTVLVAFDGDGLGNVANTVFHVNDKYRGAATGGSGRPIIWAYYIDNWLAHPLFGTGPGTVYDLGGRAYYSHNMVLQILTDGGLFGLLGFITFIIWVSIAATQIPASSVTRALAMFLLAYFIYGIFEGRAVNIGNPLSAMFFLACFLTLGHAERVRGKDRQSHAA